MRHEQLLDALEDVVATLTAEVIVLRRIRDAVPALIEDVRETTAHLVRKLDQANAEIERLRVEGGRA